MTDTVRLEFTSAFEMLDLVQLVTDHLSRIVGFDDDAQHWVGVSVRESVVNAIKHGNENDAGKRVFVEFDVNGVDSSELVIRVRDQGKGFDVESVPDPLAEENLLRSC